MYVYFSNVFNWHPDLIFVTLNSNRTLNQNRQKMSIIILGKQIKINQNVVIKWYFENTNYLQGLNCLPINAPVFLLDICRHYIESHLFSDAFSKLSLNLTMEPFK